jgi:cytochrome P450
MERIIERHLAAWVQRGELRLFDGFKQLSFAIAAELFLGLSDPAQIHAMERTFRAFSQGLFAPPAWRIPGLPYHRAWGAGQQLRQILRAAIAAHHAAPQDTVLGMLVEAHDAEGRGLSDDELLDEMLVLLWAGHDTVTSLLTWTVYELLHHPAILAAARAEQAAAGAGPLAHEQPPLLEQILREAERLHPPAPGGFRGVVEDVSYAGYHIPRGWTVMYSSVFTHRMPELWHEPDRFDPGRFAPPRAEGHKPFHLIGFGAGPRICIGYAFAKMQMHMVLGRMLRGLSLQLVPGQRFQPIAVPTSMPRDGLLVRVRPRA